MFESEQLTRTVGQFHVPASGPLWVLGGLALLLLLMIAPPLRGVRRCLRPLVLIFLLISVAALTTYCLAIDRADQVEAYQDGERTMLLGYVEAVRVAEDGRSAFVLADPTGQTTVVSDSGPPAQGSFVLVRGLKGSYLGQPFVLCQFHLSAF